MTLTSAAAQDAGREAAASAFDSGAQAYRAEDYAEAADWFETAHRYAPAPESLVAAARAHDKAGNHLRAANLALRLLREYPDHEGADTTAQAILEKSRGELVEIRVDCDACVVTLDGQEQDGDHFFVEPEQDYLLEATQGTLSRRKTVHGRPGQEVTLRVAAVELPVATEPTPSEAAVDESEGSSRKPLPPVVTYIGAGLTGVSLVISAALGIDAASGVAGYREAAAASNACVTDCADLYNEAKQLQDDGHAREKRTNIAFLATGALAVTTAVIAVFLTDWEGDESTGAALAPTSDLAGGRLLVRGRF